MTVENCIKLLKVYESNGNKKAYEDMKAHILNSRKFQGHPIVEELLDVKPTKKETKKDGKKSKG